MNERRSRSSSSRGERLCGDVLDGPVYGAERDDLVRQAKAVLNCHFYESARFEQARAFQCMSLGTPVISEWTASTQPPVQFEERVFWARARRGGQLLRAALRDDPICGGGAQSSSRRSVRTT